MFAWVNKATAIVLSIALTTQSFAGIVQEQCNYSGETDFFPVGDERGNSILTKKEIHRDCNLTIITQGACKKWEDRPTEFFLDPSDYHTFKTNDNSGALGETLAAIGAYDQIGHFWSGWKGYCERGTKTDFSWAEDPMFWASLVMSAVMEGSQDGGFLKGTAGDMSSVNQAAGNAWQSLGSSVGMNLSKDFGKCLVAGGVDMSKNLYNYFQSGDEEDCDPIDEFCEESNAPTEDKVMTIDKTQYEDMIADNPDFANYIEILGEEDGIYTIKFKNPNEMENFTQKTQEEAKKLQQKMKDIQFAISSAVVAAKMATCAATGGSGGTSYGTSAGSTGKFTVKDGIGTAINALPAQWLGPYGALIKAALAVALEFATSFKHINTCNDEEDAKAAGSRHLKTYQTLPYNLCQLTAKSCAEKKFLGSGCGLDAFHYCCYDQMLTKILVAQIKAQLGRDWAHCTGITLRDLNFVSFRQCTATDKQAGFDGTKVVQRYDADGNLQNPVNWLDSFQHKRKCIDLTEFKQYLEATFSQDIDFSDFDAIFQDVGDQIEPMPQ